MESPPCSKEIQAMNRWPIKHKMCAGGEWVNSRQLAWSLATQAPGVLCEPVWSGNESERCWQATRQSFTWGLWGAALGRSGKWVISGNQQTVTGGPSFLGYLWFGFISLHQILCCVNGAIMGRNHIHTECHQKHYPSLNNWDQKARRLDLGWQIDTSILNGSFCRRPSDES